MTPESPGSIPPTSRPRPIEPPRDGGYRAGARLSPDGDRRARRFGAAAAGLAVALIALAALDPMLSLPALPFDGDEVTPSAEATRPRPTGLPALERTEALAPTAPLPVLAGGLRWLDPRTGQLSASRYQGYERALFVEPDEILCVCLEVPWQERGSTVLVNLVREGGPSGPRPEPVTVLELESPHDRVRRGQPIVVEAAISPDHRTVYVAHAVRGETAWSFGVEAVDARTGIIRDSLVVPVVEAEDSPAWPVLRVSPDGDELRYTAWTTSFGGSGESRERTRPFRIALRDGSFDGLPRPAVVVGDPEGRDIGCGDEGYVSADRYAAVCLRVVDGVARTALIVADLSAPAAPAERVPAILLPASLTATQPDLLARGDAGLVFAWSSEGRVIARIDVASGTVEARGLVSGAAGEPGRPTAERPPPGSGAVWTSLRDPADMYRASVLLGAPDGSVLFAIGGGDAPVDGRLPSTGIWVIDAETLELVDVWAPAAYYGGIALSPDGEYLVALGVPGLDPDGRRSSFGTSLTFHRLRDGRIVEVVGDLAESSGWTPVLLSAGG